MKFIVERLEQDYNINGLESAREKYKKFFIYTKIYEKYRAATNEMLLSDGYGDCIVE